MVSESPVGFVSNFPSSVTRCLLVGVGVRQVFFSLSYVCCLVLYDNTAALVIFSDDQVFVLLQLEDSTPDVIRDVGFDGLFELQG